MIRGTVMLRNQFLLKHQISHGDAIASKQQYPVQPQPQFLYLEKVE